MTLMQVWGALVIFLVCPILGGLPFIAWITQVITRKKLTQLGTGNISVSAAFYHGGRWVGVLAVLSEALKGISAVLLAQYFFPDDATWQLIALIALVMGRYWMGRGAGTTNVVWGYAVYDPLVAGLTCLLSGVSFTILRDRQQGRIAVLVLFPLLTALRHLQEPSQTLAAIALAGLLGWIYQKIPDDLDLAPEQGKASTQSMFSFFRGDRALVGLDRLLDPLKVGQKSATLSQLKQWGYPVPMGWVLPPGDDPQPLLEFLKPSPKRPLVVRSSAIGEDSETASAAGQYVSVLNVVDQTLLEVAIARCLASYDQPSALQYRQDRGLPEDAMAILIQEQVQGVFSGVAFSRDPMTRHGDAVVLEALPGPANKVVSGKVNPERYRVNIRDTDLQPLSDWHLPNDLHLDILGEGSIPTQLVQQVAYLTRHLEVRYHGVPQDLEWSFDGETLWILQLRPITTLLPIWTRKIAAEVIPGVIRPLTWSINQPLTCGVWGELFTIVLGSNTHGLNFNETATLHYSQAYFNASLLGQLFRRMGLPPESLEFLTRGAKFSKPPLLSTLRNLPGLLRLLTREWQLVADFQRDYQTLFKPGLIVIASQSATNLSANTLLDRIEDILRLLKSATYYSILTPLSVALRKAILQVPDNALDYSRSPEVAALRSLQELALRARQSIPDLDRLPPNVETLFSTLAVSSTGQILLETFQQFLEQYGYLSEVGTDIAVPTWKEDPRPVQLLFTQLCTANSFASERERVNHSHNLQCRVDLKGQVTEIYSRLLAELRWSFVGLEQIWLQSGLLTKPGDIFFLNFAEIQQAAKTLQRDQSHLLIQQIEQRRQIWEQDSKLKYLPQLVYGHTAPALPQIVTHSGDRPVVKRFQGIGASPGRVEGPIKIARSLQAVADLSPGTILVVPYTDSGWAPILVRAGGLISEVGGQLSHGAIVAREYGIPAVMDIPHATQQLKDGQWIRLDGQTGSIEIL
jgi:pyruvate,water dikinase